VCIITRFDICHAINMKVIDFEREMIELRSFFVTRFEVNSHSVLVLVLLKIK